MPMNYWGVTHPTLPNNDASEENISEMEGLEELKMIPTMSAKSLGTLPVIYAIDQGCQAQI